MRLTLPCLILRLVRGVVSFEAEDDHLGGYQNNAAAMNLVGLTYFSRTPVPSWATTRKFLRH